MNLQLRDGGALKKQPIVIINIVSFSILFFINLFNQINSNISLLNGFLYTFPFLIAPIVCYIFRNNIKFNAYLYFIMSLWSLLTTKEPGNLTGLIFLLFSLYIFQTTKMNIIIIITTFIAICSKLFFGFSAMQIIMIIIGYIYCIIIYYILIHPKQIQFTDNKIDYDTKQLIDYLTKGFTAKEISDKIYITPSAVNKRIERVRDKFNCKTNEQLIYKLSKKGIIRP